jgi:hypothetical protein
LKICKNIGIVLVMRNPSNRGEIITILTIGTFLVLGIATLLSSTVLKNQAPTQKSKASFNCNMYPGVAAPNPQASSSNAGYYWQANCAQWCPNNVNGGGCPKNTSQGEVNEGTSAWCYGFDDGARCMQLKYGNLPNGQANTPTPGIDPAFVAACVSDTRVYYDQASAICTIETSNTANKGCGVRSTDGNYGNCTFKDFNTTGGSFKQPDGAYYLKYQCPKAPSNSEWHYSQVGRLNYSDNRCINYFNQGLVGDWKNFSAVAGNPQLNEIPPTATPTIEADQGSNSNENGNGNSNENSNEGDNSSGNSNGNGTDPNAATLSCRTCIADPAKLWVGNPTGTDDNQCVDFDPETNQLRNSSNLGKEIHFWTCTGDNSAPNVPQSWQKFYPGLINTSTGKAYAGSKTLDGYLYTQLNNTPQKPTASQCIATVPIVGTKIPIPNSSCTSACDSTQQAISQFGGLNASCPAGGVCCVQKQLASQVGDSNPDSSKPVVCENRSSPYCTTGTDGNSKYWCYPGGTFTKVNQCTASPPKAPIDCGTTHRSFCTKGTDGNLYQCQTDGSFTKVDKCPADVPAAPPEAPPAAPSTECLDKNKRTISEGKYFCDSDNQLMFCDKDKGAELIRDCKIKSKDRELRCNASGNKNYCAIIAPDKQTINTVPVRVNNITLPDGILKNDKGITAEAKAKNDILLKEFMGKTKLHVWRDKQNSIGGTCNYIPPIFTTEDDSFKQPLEFQIDLNTQELVLDKDGNKQFTFLLPDMKYNNLDATVNDIPCPIHYHANINFPILSDSSGYESDHDILSHEMIFELDSFNPDNPYEDINDNLNFNNYVKHLHIHIENKTNLDIKIGEIEISPPGRGWFNSTPFTKKITLDANEWGDIPPYSAQNSDIKGYSRDFDTYLYGWTQEVQSVKITNGQIFDPENGLSGSTAIRDELIRQQSTGSTLFSLTLNP